MRPPAGGRLFDGSAAPGIGLRHAGMSLARLDVALAALGAATLGAAALISPIAAVAIAAVVVALLLAGSRRFAVVALCLLATLAVAGVRVDASHRPSAPHAAHR